MRRTGPWSASETAAYLREATVPVRLSCRLGARLLSADREEVYIRVSPDRLHALDFTERIRDVTEGDSAADG